MKDFHEMTADEIRNYRGPVHWARLTAFAPDGRTRVRYDLEHTSAEALLDRIGELRGVELHDSGITNVCGNPNYDGIEGIDYPSQTF